MEMITIILLCVYAGIIFSLVRRLKQIQKNPAKFNKIPGYEEYTKSIWYWPTYRPYGKSTPPDNCSLPAMGAIWIVAVVWYLFSEYLYHWFLIRGKGGECPFTSSYSFFFGSVIIMLYCSFWADYSTMFSKRPVAICNNLHCIFRKDSRSTAWEKMTKMALVFTLIFFPVRVMMLNNYGYVNSEKLVYNRVLSFKEQVFAFNDIDRIEVVYNEDGSKLKHCYIYNGEGKRFDLAASYTCVDDRQFEVIDYVAEHLPEELQAELKDCISR